ncbi:family 2 encapsulin nanocompartment cargo protein polyprenyl transferase [Actinomadura bangladeshensis]|uniref:Polyprenyl synthetase family protein n=1 Tax=Actinomadura bangladeshensis TaxID=453573 RepID=A0A6L9QLI1_9ACTN|nr:family 2 encapsulin nanocompartment cargo protein polyprenyl transferase [Actinomadura bangladeshensis]NEA26205.1 polyprenyl synthetase family protein [Actinomadura bangladeshensis]
MPAWKDDPAIVPCDHRPDEGARSADGILRWSRRLLDPALRDAVEAVPGEAARIAAYHFGWRDEHGRPAEGPAGKAIRPALALLAAEAAGGTAAAALPAAVAVELTHNFSLLHDDVMDGDPTRRHRPTAWTVFGTNAAILTGDALLAAAYEVLAEDGSPAVAHAVRVLSRAVLDLVEGQCADLAFEDRDDVTLDECLAMAGRKTGALMGASCALGALYGGAASAEVESMRAFGQCFGLAFQLADDLLGIWGDPAATGKPVHSDLHNRKKSLPVVAALTSGTPAAAELAGLYFRGAPLTPADTARAAALIESTGARDWATGHAARLLAEARDHLAGAAEAPAAELLTLVRLSTQRDH